MNPTRERVQANTNNDADLEQLVEELAAEDILITKEEARQAVQRLANLLLLISKPLLSENEAVHEDPAPEPVE